ncbi:hypothetical protein [Vibrio cyclitrophicus]|uniref:hypothetical protein n=1 Tax=Vibrio cyclitrophicus TaxID=47951 RepID=UPI000C824BB2|nr:hypothetical protein [Vibrio cyclitrophicus]PMN19685.1 hypothetical protein BCT37_18745 [Vibrio cyclitrophicus]
MSNQRKTPAEIIQDRMDVLQKHSDEYQSNPSLTDQGKEAASHYYRGALIELYRLKETLKAR